FAVPFRQEHFTLAGEAHAEQGGYLGFGNPNETVRIHGEPIWQPCDGDRASGLAVSADLRYASAFTTLDNQPGSIRQGHGSFGKEQTCGKNIAHRQPLLSSNRYSSKRGDAVRCAARLFDRLRTVAANPQLTPS